MMSEPSLREKLNAEVMEADWYALRGHYERQALIWVSRELNLVDVGEAFAEDNTKLVETWITEKKLQKVSPKKASAWAESPSQGFSFLIVAPFVLIHEKVH